MIITQNSRMYQHRITASGSTFTIPVNEDFTSNEWLATDLGIGEIGINTTDNRIFYRSNNSINELLSNTTKNLYIDKITTETLSVNSKMIVYNWNDAKILQNSNIEYLIQFQSTNYATINAITYSTTDNSTTLIKMNVVAYDRTTNRSLGSEYLTTFNNTAGIVTKVNETITTHDGIGLVTQPSVYGTASNIIISANGLTSSDIRWSIRTEIIQIK